MDIRFLAITQPSSDQSGDNNLSIGHEKIMILML